METLFDAPAAATPAAGPGQWPRLLGLALLERVSYYGVLSLLVLYLMKRLQVSRPEGSAVYEVLLALIYLLPVLGAWFADQWWGPARTLRVGSLVLVPGAAAMALSGFLPVAGPLTQPLFLGGLGLLAAGTAFFRPGFYTTIGHLTRQQPARQLPLFIWALLVVNVGAFLAPLLVGGLGDTGRPDDFRWGFLLCALVSVGVAGMAWGVRDPAPVPPAPVRRPAAPWTWLLALALGVGAMLAMLLHPAMPPQLLVNLQTIAVVGLLLVLLVSWPPASYPLLLKLALLLVVAFLVLVVNFAAANFIQLRAFGDGFFNPVGAIVGSFFLLAGLWLLVRHQGGERTGPSPLVLLLALAGLLAGLAVGAWLNFSGGWLGFSRLRTHPADPAQLKLLGFAGLYLLTFFETTWNALVPVVLMRRMPPHLLARSLALFYLLFVLAAPLGQQVIRALQ